MPRELWTPYGYHSAPPPVDPGGVTPITTNQQGVAMMAPHGYISAAPSPVYPVYYGGWEQCRWVGPFRPSPLFPPPGVCTMVQAWLVLSTRLWLLCRVLIHRPGLWVHLGPLSKTPRGNTVILMLIDQFTKWIECYPLPDQSAEVVAKAIVEDFFSRFGVPREIHTDQGRNFVSNLFTSLCSLLQVRKTQTTGYSPSRPLTSPMPPGVSSSPWWREISARRTSCPRTSPPSVMRMSVGSVPGSSSEGVCPSTSSGDSSSAHQSSLEDQEVRDQLRQFRHMLEGLERRLDNRLRDSPLPRQPVTTPPGFAAFPLAEPHPSLLVETPAAPPVPMESSVQPPAAFTMGQAREQRVAASGPVTTVTRSAPVVSTVAPAAPRVSTSVVLPSGTATVALPGRPQVPLGRGFLSASRMASAATQAPGRVSVPRAPAPTRTPSPAPPGNPEAWQQVPYRNRAPAQSQQPRRTEAPSVHEHQLTHVPATRAAQRAESVSAPPTPPSSATAMKTKRRKPSQLARESRLRKCFNCGERGHLSLECARPCYKCNIAGHHSARCPYSVTRAPGQEASSSSHSLAQSTPERPVQPTSGGDSSPAVSQPPPQGVLPSATPAPHPSLGRGLPTLSTFLPLPPAGRGAQLLAALNRNRSAAASETRQLGLPLSPLLRLRHSRDWVRPRLGDSSSAPPVPPRSPPQCPRLFQAQVRPQPRNSHGHPPAPRPRSSLTLHLHKVNRWEGRPQDRVRPRPVAPRESVILLDQGISRSR